MAPPLHVRAGPARAGERSRIWRKFVRNPAALTGAVILLAVIGAAVFAPYVAPHDPTRQSLIRRFTPPVWTPAGRAAHPLGTDQVGRDILSRMIHGARVSLLVGISAVLVSLVVGVTLGLLSGFLQGRVDTVVMTVVDVTLSFPQLLLAINRFLVNQFEDLPLSERFHDVLPPVIIHTMHNAIRSKSLI